MGYEVTGFARSLTIRVYKMAYGSVVSGYPKSYDGKTNIDFLAYYSPLYSSISDDEMAKVSLVDFNARLNDFKAWLETIEDGLDFNTALIFADEDARIASDDCGTTSSTTTILPTTTTTSTSSTTTTSTTSEPTTTTTSTTVLQYRAAMYVGPSAPDISTETVIPYSENTQIILNSPTLEGINYFFISIPEGKTLTVYDMFMANITSEFEYHSDQQREGYYDNTIYRKMDIYDTTGSTTFYLIIS